MDHLKADDALLANADEKLCDQSYDVEPFGRCAGHSDLLWVLEAAGDVCINRQALLATDSAMDRSKAGVDLVLCRRETVCLEPGLEAVRPARCAECLVLDAAR